MLYLVQVGNIVGVAGLAAADYVGDNLVIVQSCIIVVLIGVAVVPSHRLFHFLVVLLAPCREAEVRHELGGCCAASISSSTATDTLKLL